MAPRIQSLLSKGNSAFGQIVRREFHFHLVSGQDTNVILPHLARDVRHDDVSIFEFDSKHRDWAGYHYRAGAG